MQNSYGTDLSENIETNTDKEDENFCMYGGIFGVLITCTSLFQLLVFSNFHWVTIVLTLLFIYSAISYITLGLRKGSAVPLIYINIVITLVIYIFYIISGIWSLIVIFLCTYNAVIASIAMVEGLNQRLKARSKLLKQEQEFWEGKL